MAIHCQRYSLPVLLKFNPFTADPVNALHFAVLVKPTIFTVRGLHVMQRTVLLSEFCPSVCPSDTCIVTKLNNALRIF